MSGGVPIRLSAALANRARKAAAIHDRSLTEQVEHWARLGQVVESAVHASTVARLKSISKGFSPEQLQDVVAFIDTPAARKKAARSIASKNPVRYGTKPGAPTTIIKVTSRRRLR